MLEEDLLRLAHYYKQWHLKPNPSKSESCLFHLCNRDADKTLAVSFDGLPVLPATNPKYLGVPLDRTLSFKYHLEKLGKKLNSRINIIRKLASTSWGADVDTLRTSTIGLVYSAAEYCAPVWTNSSHTYKVDVQLNKVLGSELNYERLTYETPTISHK